MRNKGTRRLWSSDFVALVFVRLSASEGFKIVFDSQLAKAMLMLWPTSNAISTSDDSLVHNTHKLF